MLWYGLCKHVPWKREDKIIVTSQWGILFSHMLLLHNQETNFHVTWGLGMSHWGWEGCEQEPVSRRNQGTGVQKVPARGKEACIHGQGPQFI